MEIKNNLFDLTEEQIKTSEMMYDGKVVKCLVAPYHNNSQLENVIPYTKTTFLFPERDMTSDQLRSLISMVVALPTTEEIRIVTASQSIIIDMVDTSVRILTQSGDVVPCPCKTFMANIHDIRYSVLENPAHQTSQEEKKQSKDKLNDILAFYTKVLEAVQQQKDTTKLKKEYLKNQTLYCGLVNSVGEDIIRNILKNHIAYIEENLL